MAAPPSPALVSSLVAEFFHEDRDVTAELDAVGDGIEVVFAVSIDPREAVRAATLSTCTMEALHEAFREAAAGVIEEEVVFRTGDAPLSTDQELCELVLAARAAQVVPQVGAVPRSTFFESTADLAACLLAEGVNAAEWPGQTGASIHQLQRELDAGLSVFARLPSGEAVRRVNSVYVLLFNSDRSQALVRATTPDPQRMVPKCRFSRFASAYGAGLGALERETGFPPSRVVPLGFQNPRVFSRGSQTFQGLQTQYHIDLLELQLAPGADEAALPEGWVWSQAAAGVTPQHFMPQGVDDLGDDETSFARKGLAMIGYLSQGSERMLGSSSAGSASGGSSGGGDLPDPAELETPELEAWLISHDVDTSRYGMGGAKLVSDLLRELRKGECEIVVEEDDEGTRRPLRVVKVAKATIRHPTNPDLILIETHEMIRDSVRVVHKTLSEKFLPGEATWKTVRRGIEEEILDPIRRGYVTMDDQQREALEGVVAAAGGSVASSSPANPRVSAAPSRRARNLNLRDGDDVPVEVRPFGNDALFSADRLTLLGVSAPVIEYNDSPSYPGLRSKYCLHAMEVRLDFVPTGSFSTLEGRNIHYWSWRRLTDIHIMKNLQNRVALYMHLALKLSRNRGAQATLERYLFEACENNDVRALTSMLESWTQIVTKLRMSETAREIDANIAASKQILPGSGTRSVPQQEPIADPLTIVDRQRNTLLAKAACCGKRCAAVTDELILRTLRKHGLMGTPLEFGGATAGRHCTAAGAGSPAPLPEVPEEDEGEGAGEEKTGEETKGDEKEEEEEQQQQQPKKRPSVTRQSSDDRHRAQVAESRRHTSSIVNATDAHGHSMLHRAAMVDSSLSVRRLLGLGADANSCCPMCLVAAGCTNALALLLPELRSESQIHERACGHPTASARDRRYFQALLNFTLTTPLVGPPQLRIELLSLVLRQCNPSLGFYSSYMRSFLVLTCSQGQRFAEETLLTLVRSSTHSLHTALEMSRLLRRMMAHNPGMPSLMLRETADGLEELVANVLRSCQTHEAAVALLREPCSMPAWTPALSVAHAAALGDQASDTLLQMVVRGSHKRVVTCEYFQACVREVWHGRAHALYSRHDGVPCWQSAVSLTTLLAVVPVLLLSALRVLGADARSAVLDCATSPQFKFWLSGVMQAGFVAVIAGVIWEADEGDNITVLEGLLFLFGCGLAFDFALSCVLLKRRALQVYENRINCAITLGLFVTLCARNEDPLYRFMVGMDMLLAAFKLLYLICMTPSARMGSTWFAVAGAVKDTARFLVVLAPIVGAYTAALYATVEQGAHGFEDAGETFETVAWTVFAPFLVNGDYFAQSEYWIAHMWFLNLSLLVAVALLIAMVVDTYQRTTGTAQADFAFATAQLAFHFNSVSSWPSPANLLAWTVIAIGDALGMPAGGQVVRPLQQQLQESASGRLQRPEWQGQRLLRAGVVEQFFTLSAPSAFSSSRRSGL